VKTLVNNGIAVPSNVGKGSMPSYNDKLFDAGVYSTGEGQDWVGQADDPFFLDLRVFDLLYGGDLSEVGDDTLAGFNVNSMAIQVPNKDLAMSGEVKQHPVIGVWTTASRRSMVITKNNGNQDFQGDYVQVSRLGNPLVNEVVIPRGQKDAFNGSKPKNDSQFLKYVQSDPELPEVMHAVYPSLGPVPDSNKNQKGIQRDDLVQVFLTGVAGLNQPHHVTPSEELRLNMTIAPCPQSSCNKYSRLGVIGGDLAGFPNGRRPGDDTVDIALRVVMGRLCYPLTIGGNSVDLGLCTPANAPVGNVPFTDGAPVSAADFDTTFPYLTSPLPGSGGY
jgi:hypothetical protein